jgi:type III secretion apparatus needle protein
MGLDMNSIFSRLGGQVGGLESQLNSALGSGQADDPQSLIAMQMQLQRWSIATELQTNTVKVIGDSLKNTVQNIH